MFTEWNTFSCKILKMYWKNVENVVMSLDKVKEMLQHKKNLFAAHALEVL